VKTTVLTLAALLAFAGNSVLCRLALINDQADPLGFTAIRLVSGAVTLFILLWLLGSDKRPNRSQETGSWWGASALFIYAILFSYAYVVIDTATGALILFGSVQIAMITYSLISGQRLNVAEWCGVAFALTGFVYLIYPELSTPSVSGLFMMMLSGVAWAAYTLLGNNAQHALRVTAYNFLRSLPMVVLLVVFLFKELDISPTGVYLAVASGALTSGVGYAIWYAALRGLNNTQASVSMVAVPVIAALGGVVFAGEQISARLFIASVIVLSGILMVIFSHKFTR